MFSFFLRYIKFFFLLGLLLLAGCSSKRAEHQPDSVESKAEMERSLASQQKAIKLLRKAAAYLANASVFSFRVQSLRDEVLEDNVRVQIEHNSNVLVKRPDQVKVTGKGDLDSIEIYLQQSSLTLFDPVKKLHASIDVPVGIDASFNHLIKNYGFSIPLAELIYNELESIAAKHENGEYVGLHYVNGVAAHHLRFEQPNVDTQIWIAAKGRPLPLKIVIFYKQEEGGPQFTGIISDWKILGSTADKSFSFKPPAGSLKIDLLPLEEESR